MKQELYACVHAAGFPVQALLRLRSDLEVQPVAVLDGQPPLQSVCSLNRQAQLKGASLHMSKLEAESVAGLCLLARSPETEQAARTALFECAANFSPRIEQVHSGTSCAYVLDIAGTDRLFGPPAVLAERLRTSLASAGFRVSIAIGANFHTVRLKAAATRGISVIPRGDEAAALSRLPLSVLNLAPELADTFLLWGIQTLGELAALPDADLVSRLGAQAASLRALAGGSATHPFSPSEPHFALKEFCDFETPVENSESLLFVASRMIECLVARASSRAYSLASLTLRAELEGGRVYRRVIRPAVPTIDRKFLLKLLQLDVAAHSPQAAVLLLEITAEPSQPSRIQLGLFSPQSPEPSRIDVTIARLKAIAGEDRVGSPVLDDSHRPGAFTMANFLLSPPHPPAQPSQATHPRPALRRIRPALPVRVEIRGLKPVAFHDNERRFKVSAAYGPWKNDGCWWSAGWNVEEWDVLAQTNAGAQVACLLVRSHELRENGRSLWQLEAFYD